MSESEQIALINSLVGPVIVVLVLLLAAAMGIRVIGHLRSRRRTPLLLARDFLLFLYLVLIVVAQQASRANPDLHLGQQVWWIVVSSALAIAVLGVWLAIEFAVVGKRRDEDD